MGHGSLGCFHLEGYPGDGHQKEIPEHHVSRVLHIQTSGTMESEGGPNAVMDRAKN